MSCLRGGLRFTQELFVVGFGEFFFSRNLDRDDAIQFRIARFPNFSEGSLAQAVQNWKWPSIFTTEPSSAAVSTSLFREIETTAARRTRDVLQRIVVEQFNRIVAVRAAVLHDGTR
jgi:hypothetical protein